LIGRSLLEIYINEANASEIISKLRDQKVTVIENLDLMKPPAFGKNVDVEEKVVQRLAYLYLRHKVRNFRECILEGLPEDCKTKINNRVEDIIDNSQAKLDKTSSQ